MHTGRLLLKEIHISISKLKEYFNDVQTSLGVQTLQNYKLKKSFEAIHTSPEPSLLVKQRTCYAPANMSTRTLSSEPKAKLRTQIRLLKPTLP